MLTQVENNLVPTSLTSLASILISSNDVIWCVVPKLPLKDPYKYFDSRMVTVSDTLCLSKEKTFWIKRFLSREVKKALKSGSLLLSRPFL